MNYFKRSVAIIIAIATMITSAGGAYVGKTTTEDITKTVSYTDSKVKTYTTIELNNKIEEHQDIIQKADAILVNAQALNWPETCDAIYMAETELNKTQRLIEHYSILFQPCKQHHRFRAN